MTDQSPLPKDATPEQRVMRWLSDHAEFGEDPVAVLERLTRDRFQNIFERQRTLMEQLIADDKLPEYPIDITTKYGQRQIKELVFAMIEELTEGTYILKNRPHRFTDHSDVDFEHFREELGDALAYFIEILIFAGISPEEIYQEYCRKNAIVQKRVKERY